jgi:adenylosuccinate synthase
LSVDVIVGLQWGDEGKGRIVDFYARDYNVIARFGGGDNAGHTLVTHGETIALRLIPSGILQPEAELFIGAGCVVNPTTLVEELERLGTLGIDPLRVLVSDRALAVLPEHIDADKRREAERAAEAIGTTGRGIGPAYADRAWRTGITLRRYCDEAQTTEAKRLGSHLVDGIAYIHERLESGNRILAEGAQGTMLDVIYGTYPFVTSSNTIAGGACTGLGVGPKHVRRVIGIAKAYCTRVGGGPFPSELNDRDGERLRERGHEFGTVTGRPRRCGWFDAVAARYAVRVNGIDAIALTKLDVLSGFERIGVVTHYRENGEVELERFEGWEEDLRAVRRVADLPRAAQTYVQAIGTLVGAPIEVISVGPERDHLAR